MLLVVRDALAMSQLQDVAVYGAAYVTDQRYRWFISQQTADIRRRCHERSLAAATRNPSRPGSNGGGGSGRVIRIKSRASVVSGAAGGAGGSTGGSAAAGGGGVAGGVLAQQPMDGVDVLRLAQEQLMMTQEAGFQEEEAATVANGAQFNQADPSVHGSNRGSDRSGKERKRAGNNNNNSTVSATTGTTADVAGLLDESTGGLHLGVDENQLATLPTEHKLLLLEVRVSEMLTFITSMS